MGYTIGSVTLVDRGPLATEYGDMRLDKKAALVWALLLGLIAVGSGFDHAAQQQPGKRQGNA